MICDGCGMPCQPVRRDMGIGPYEYWGARGVHHDWQWVSPCCEADVVEGDAAIVRTTLRVARKARYAIPVGCRYEETVWKHWRANGPSWFSVRRRPLVDQGT